MHSNRGTRNSILRDAHNLLAESRKGTEGSGEQNIFQVNKKQERCHKQENRKQ